MRVGLVRWGRGLVGPVGLVRLVGALVALGVAGCDDPPPFPDAGDCKVEPTLSSLKATYFANSCAFSGCHLGSRAEGKLDLTRADLHAILVGVVADDEVAGPRGKLRVVAGDPAASFMVQKVEGTQAADEGGIMPDQTDEIIDPDCSVAALKQWIADGALDN